MKTVETNVYSFDELTPKAQERAFDHFCSTYDYPYENDNQEVLDEFCKLFDISVDFVYGYAYTLQFIVRTKFQYGEEELSGVRLMAYLQNNFMKYLTLPKVWYNEKCTKKYFSKVFFEEREYPLTGYYIDEDILKPIYDFLSHPNSNVTFVKLMEKCIANYLKVAQADYDSVYSIEYFENECKETEALFLEDGRVYNF